MWRQIVPLIYLHVSFFSDKLAEAGLHELLHNSDFDQCTAKRTLVLC